ncbi:cytochrome P450 [Aspergillus costaricaensis CBS 115574]|uniref:Cytochrome P450 n=1 Tax=Aspergillus costaricaensis CBS 115574 TaxID=1448317 RepID=A0ACD1IEZ4_9EURO|nr:cytochrome P450 [Aspergillus costaricaensis CBS 115574]RAK89185.1 cytochrome P450 [Aspergillus costaricaensis CBS 115574]
MAEDDAISIIVATVIFLYLSVVTYNLFIHPLKEFPGPRTLAASRIPVAYASLKGIQTHWLHSLHLRYGPVVRVAPNELSFIDERAWKDIYSSSPTVPQTLSRQQPILAKYGDALVETLSGMEGHITNIRDMFHYTLFEIVGHFQYGEEMGVLRTGARKSWLRKAYFKPSNDLIDHRLQIQSDEPDLIGLTFRNSRSSALTEKDIRANAHIMMLGGAETTLGLMTFLTACLLQHPECFARLKKEIRTNYHDKKEVSLESVSKLAYLDACIKEALRTYPPIPGAIHRVSPAGGASIAGHWVAGNTRGAEGPYQKDIKAACHPFSTGPRSCIGQDMAYGMTKVVFCKFATEFNCELASDDTGSWLTGLRSWGTWEVPPLMVRVSRVEKASI